MVLDTKQNKGIRRKYLPEPNPTKVELEKDSSLVTVFEKSIELYYKEMPNVSVSDVMLADSAGNIIDIKDQDSWKLGDYYSVNQYTPSRHKLYTVVNLPKVKL